MSADGASADDASADGAPTAKTLQLIEEAVIQLCTSGAFRAAQQWRRKALRLTKVNSLRVAYHRGHGTAHVQRVSDVDGAALRARYLRFAEPVILTDVIDGWPALTRWTPEYLTERFGNLEVQACFDRTSQANPDADIKRFFQTRPFCDVVQAIADADGTNDVYLTGNNKFFDHPEAACLLDDLDERVVEYLDDKGLTPANLSLWYGPAGTITTLHHDPTSVLYAQVRGEKRFRLLSPHNMPALMAATHTYPDVDVQAAAREAGDHLYEVTLRPGELLLLPAGWWHEVSALTESISIGITNLAGPTSFSWYLPGDLGDEQVTREPPSEGESS